MIVLEGILLLGLIVSAVAAVLSRRVKKFLK